MATHGVRQYIDIGSGFPTAWRSPITLRAPREIEDLFSGFELVAPGLVTTTEWGTDEPAPTGQSLILAAVGRVP